MRRADETENKTDNVVALFAAERLVFRGDTRRATERRRRKAQLLLREASELLTDLSEADHRVSWLLSDCVDLLKNVEEEARQDFEILG